MTDGRCASKLGGGIALCCMVLIMAVDELPSANGYVIDACGKRDGRKSGLCPRVTRMLLASI